MSALEILRYCRDVQIKRIQRLLLLESLERKLLPNGRKEILALVEINGELIRYEQGTGQQAGEGAKDVLHSEHSPAVRTALHKISQLGPLDRNLMREISELLMDQPEKIDREMKGDRQVDEQIVGNPVQ